MMTLSIWFRVHTEMMYAVKSKQKDDCCLSTSTTLCDQKDAAVEPTSFFSEKYTTLTPFLIGPALVSDSSILELCGIGSAGHGGSFWQLHTETTPVAPMLPKPGQEDLIQTWDIF